MIAAGSTAPFLAVWLIEQTGDELAPALLVMVVAVVGLLAIASVPKRLARPTERPAAVTGGGGTAARGGADVGASRPAR